MSEHELRKLPPPAVALRDERCELCKAYAPDAKQLRQGMCCYSSPKPMPLAGGGVMGMWAPVKATDFCVEHFTPLKPSIEVRGSGLVS